MLLNITELDNHNIEDIPENYNIKKVRFDDSSLISQKPLHQSIPKINAKMVRPHTPHKQSQINYEKILSKMGMFVSDGKLLLIDKDKTQHNLSNEDQHNLQNSFIYNKYFNKNVYNEEPVIRKPKNLQEYEQMLLDDFIQKQRIKQIKSNKLIMPTTNINFSHTQTTPIKLFNFSKR